MSIKDQIIEALADAEFQTCNITDEVMSFLKNLNVNEPKQKVLIGIRGGVVNAISATDANIEIHFLDYDGLQVGEGLSHYSTPVHQIFSAETIDSYIDQEMINHAAPDEEEDLSANDPESRMERNMYSAQEERNDKDADDYDRWENRK